MPQSGIILKSSYLVDKDNILKFFIRLVNESRMAPSIVGIDRAIHMQSRVWREVDYDTEQFNKMIYGVWDDVFLPFSLRGAYIADPRGKNVGVWYSGIWYAAVRFEENNRIVIMSDTPFQGGPSK
jgi:hypothetical protein